MSKLAERLQQQALNSNMENNSIELEEGLSVTTIPFKEGNLDIESIPYKYEWKQVVVDGIVYEDPRPDMPEDSFLWLQLFVDADAVNKDLCEKLQYIRTPGSRIVRGKTMYVIKPAIDEEGRKGWLNEAQYREYAEKWLGPHKELLTKLLKNLENLFPLNQVLSQQALNI